jgi:hypothetical protein
LNQLRFHIGKKTTPNGNTYIQFYELIVDKLFERGAIALKDYIKEKGQIYIESVVLDNVPAQIDLTIIFREDKENKVRWKYMS